MKLFVFQPSHNWGYMGGVVGILAHRLEDCQEIVNIFRKDFEELGGDANFTYPDTTVKLGLPVPSSEYQKHYSLDSGFQMTYSVLDHEPGSSDYAWVLKYALAIDSESFVWEAIAHGKGKQGPLTPRVLFADGNNA